MLLNRRLAHYGNENNDIVRLYKIQDALLLNVKRLLCISFKFIRSIRIKDDVFYYFKTFHKLRFIKLRLACVIGIKHDHEFIDHIISTEE